MSSSIMYNVFTRNSISIVPFFVKGNFPTRQGQSVLFGNKPFEIYRPITQATHRNGICGAVDNVFPFVHQEPP